jgi:hypothetical protein
MEGQLTYLVPFSHLLEQQFLRAVTPYNKVHVRKTCTYLRDYIDNQVNTLAVNQPREHDNIDLVCRRPCGCVWLKFLRVHSVRQRGNYARVQRGSQHQVFSAALDGMRK